MSSEQHRLRLDSVRFLNVHIRPSAQRTSWGDTLSDGTQKISVAAPPEDGKANIELIRFLANHFNVPRSCIEIVSGHTGRRKTVKIMANG